MAKLNIGMSFSGGGYRAATFHLGTLSFLNTILVRDGESLLDCISVLSTVSGGTITGLKYMLALSQKQDIDTMVHELFDFLYNEDLVEDAFANIEKGRTDNGASLIKIMAKIYDAKLFNHVNMGHLMECICDIPVKHFSANATDFNNALPFRFQITEGQKKNDTKLAHGVIGNNDHRINKDIAQHITLGETLACSSCFPGGFEPMMFPDDFDECKKEIRTKKDNFGIMDGGIVDNQGIEPILLAEERMHNCDKEKPDKALDLIIVSDVASPDMNRYSPCEQKLPECIGKWTIVKLQQYALFTEIIISLLLIIALFANNYYIIGAFIMVWGLVTITNFGLHWIGSKIVRSISNTIIGKNAFFIKHLPFAYIESLLMNRARSVLMMSSSVFMKRIRKMSYDTLYSDKEWQNRLISNTIYELRANEEWASRFRNGTLSDYLKPSIAIQQNSSKATKMGTTLWFTKEDKESGVPEAILAAGQYTICYNLLEYIERIEKKGDNLNENHQLIISCKQQLQEAWKKFQENPLWMASEYR